MDFCRTFEHMMSNIQDKLLEHGLKKLQTTDNQEPKNSGCADLFHDIPVPGLLNRFYATCSGNEEKKRRIKINQGLIGRIPISTNTAFRIMQCCIIHQWNSPCRFHALSLTCFKIQELGSLQKFLETLPKSRVQDRSWCRCRLCVIGIERGFGTLHMATMEPWLSNQRCPNLWPPFPCTTTNVAGRNAATDLHICDLLYL